MILDAIIGAILIPFCFINSLSEKIKLWLKISMFSVSIILNLLPCIFPNVKILYLSIVYIIVAVCVVLIVLFTNNKLINAFSVIAGYIITIIANNIILFILDVVFGLSLNDIAASMKYLIPFYILFFALAFFLTRIWGHLIKKLDLELLKKYHVSGIVLINLIICVSILIFNISYGRFINYPSETIYFNCILFLLYFLLSILLIRKIMDSTKKAIKAEEQEKRYADLEKHLEELDETNSAFRKFRHDYKNILLSMQLYIQNRNIDELTTYFNEHIFPTRYEIDSDTNNLDTLNKLNDVPLRSILSSKLNTALIKEINVGIDIPKSVTIPVLDPLDISRIMGILLDNAIESALESEFPEISIFIVENNGICKICLMNRKSPYHNPDLNLLHEKGYSTKGSGRGLGLHTVNEILNKYEKVTKRINSKTNYFIYNIFIEL